MTLAPQFEKFTALFDAALCANCRREVLLYRVLHDDELAYACMACEHLVDTDEPDTKHRKVNDAAARRLGLSFAGDENVDVPSGCGKPNCRQGKCKSSGKRHPFSEDKEELQ